MLLGCIGDDFTGSSDLGNTLARGGLSTVQYCRIPDRPADASVEAGIVALKSRSIPAEEAVSQSLRALGWLLAQGCRQILFKYCSTFDSTPKGNIGPVAEALARALGNRVTVVCPAFPSLGRRVFQGHLFVGDRLLSESGMERHPLNPMTDPDIRRWLALQSKSGVAHVPYSVVHGGRDVIRAALDDIGADGPKLVVVDAATDADLVEIGAAASSFALLTGGSGIALGLPEIFREAGLTSGVARPWRGDSGPVLALSGSCSAATRGQVEAHGRTRPVLRLAPDEVISGRTGADEILGWLAEHRDAYPMVASTASPEDVQEVQAMYGAEAASRAIERLFAEVARRAADAGFTRLVVAGGETSGAAVLGLDLEALEIGPEIAPGVPAMASQWDGGRIALALKSGNFGDADFFEKAAAVLGAT